MVCADSKGRNCIVGQRGGVTRSLGAGGALRERERFQLQCRGENQRGEHQEVDGERATKQVQEESEERSFQKRKGKSRVMIWGGDGEVQEEVKRRGKKVRRGRLKLSQYQGLPSEGHSP